MSKRFRVTKTGKVEKRTNGQAHFNARETGNTKRNKRSDIIMRPPMTNFIKSKIAK